MCELSIYIPISCFVKVKKIIEQIKEQDFHNIELFLPPMSEVDMKYFSKENSFYKINFLKSKNNNLLITEAIKAARSSYFKIITDISGWPTDFLSHQISSLSKHPECTILSSRLSACHQITSKKGISPLLPINEGLMCISGKDAIDTFNLHEKNWIGLFEQTLWRINCISEIDNILILNGLSHPGKEDFVIYTHLLLKGNLLIDHHLNRKSGEAWSTDDHATNNEQFRKTPAYKLETLRFIKNINDLGFHGSNFGQTIIKKSHGKSTSIDLIEILQTNEWHENNATWQNNGKPSDFIKGKIAQKLISSNDIKIIIVTKDNSIKIPKELDEFIELRESLYSKNIFNQPNNTWVLFLEATTQLNTSNLFKVAIELIENGDIFSAIYTDFITTNEVGITYPAHLPTCNLDYIISKPSIFTKSILLKLSSIQKYEKIDENFEIDNLKILLNIITHEGIHFIGHLPITLTTVVSKKINEYKEIKEIQSYLCERGFYYSTVSSSKNREGVYHIQYPHKENPLVSIILDAQPGEKSTQGCIENLIKNTDYNNYEIIIIDSNKKSPNTWLNSISEVAPEKIKIISFEENRTHAEKINEASAVSRGEFLLLLDNSCFISQSDWLKELLNQCIRPEIAASQPKILHPNGSIINSGMILGYQGVSASAPYRYCSPSTSGYLDSLYCTRNISTLDISCFLIKKNLLNQCLEKISNENKFDFSGQHLATLIGINLLKMGFLITWTPHAHILHFGEVSPSDKDSQITQSELKEKNEHFLRKNWEAQISSDLFHNPNLKSNSHRLEPRFSSVNDWSRLLNKKSKNVALVHADFGGCGHYRIIQPAKSISDFGLANTICSEIIPEYSDLHINNIDCLVLQRPFDPTILNKIKNTTRFKNIFKVIDVDDNLLNLPKKNPAYHLTPHDILNRMKSALDQVDRFVVSTEALANIYSSMHRDIVVSRNYLPLHWWGNFQREQTEHPKPRVGWAGGSSHQGDLDLITDLVKLLHKEVDWIFMGMCPENIRPYIKEFHVGTHINDYPRKLASLDLDLAIAPLEDNIFNVCKSDLRLLEYGACGYPVVCSNIGPYKISDLPVTRVENNLRSWLDAIRWHTNDLESSYKSGLYLKEEVLKKYSLNQKNSEIYLKNWT